MTHQQFTRGPAQLTILPIHGMPEITAGADLAALITTAALAGPGLLDGDIVVSCVDTRSARRGIHARLFEPYSNCHYWLDLGNQETTGNCILGQPPHAHRRKLGENVPRLPCVTELFPELLNETALDDNRPSCSVRMSLAAQGLFINDVVVRYASHLLFELFSKGRIAQHGVLINLDSKRSGPIDVDPLAWRRFGYEATTPPMGAFG